MSELKKGFFQRLKDGLSKTRKGLVDKIDQVVIGRKKIDEELYDELEEILISSDVGVKTSFALIERVRERLRRGESDNAELITGYLKEEMLAILNGVDCRLENERAKPFIILVAGINGAGKTTTIGKLAMKYKSQGRSVMLCAGDTFRAAAIEQLEVWGERAGCPVIKQKEGTDPSAVLFDAIKAAKSRGVDILIVDTAGRLHTKVNLMEELKKIKRIADKEMPGASPEILLVLDATIGQNALSQAKLFKEAVDVTGIVLTKLDGTSKGGIVLSIVDELKIPVKYIGIGESIEDLRPFEPADFVEALF